MFSILEQHGNGSWWYHIGETYDTRDEAEAEGQELYGGGHAYRFGIPRAYKVIEHTKPFPQDLDRCSMDCITFGFAGGYEFSLEDGRSGRGGARPGSGRKPKAPETKRVQFSLTVDPLTREKWRDVRRFYGQEANRLVERYICRLFGKVHRLWKK